LGYIDMARPRAVAAVKISSSSLFTQQLRQFSNVRRNPPRFVVRQQALPLACPPDSVNNGESPGRS
jgi:hypothetical protein